MDMYPAQHPFTVVVALEDGKFARYAAQSLVGHCRGGDEKPMVSFVCSGDVLTVPASDIERIIVPASNIERIEVL